MTHQYTQVPPQYNYHYPGSCGGPPVSSPGQSVVNPNIKRIVIEDTIEIISPLIRNFRESGVYTLDSYHHLLRRMCRACEIPSYQPNLPIFVISRSKFWNLNSKNDRGVYAPKKEEGFVGKFLVMVDHLDIRCFIALWSKYLHDRNDGFRGYLSYISGKLYGAEQDYVKKVMEKSQPQKVRGIDRRAYVERGAI